jgi:hypothetical protein
VNFVRRKITMIQYTREQIRSFIRCPQLGSTDYGEWGALRLEQRLAISNLLDQLDSAEARIRVLEDDIEDMREYELQRARDAYDAMMDDALRE